MNPRVGDRLEALAAENDIATQRAALGRAAPNDANPLPMIRGMPRRVANYCNSSSWILR